MLKTRPLRVLFHCEFGVTTGFGGVSENIIDRLHELKTAIGTKKYELTVMSLGLMNYPFAPRPQKPYAVIPMYGNQQQHQFGQDYARDLIARVRPDIVVTFGDIWMCDFWNNKDIIPEEMRRRFKLLAYIAIDGYPVPKKWIPTFQNFDKLITFTQFGVDSINERAKQMGKKVDVDYIYHGIDFNAFRPLPKAEIQAFKEQKQQGDKIIIGLFSRNQPRKHHPEFIEFAAKLLKKTNNDPRYMFYMHCMENDAGWELGEIIDDVQNLRITERLEKFGTVYPNQDIGPQTYDLKKRFIFPGITNPGAGLPIPQLNMMYNMCDMHILLTSGEGFGCTLIESMAAGVPTLTNDYAAGAELVRNSGAGEVVKTSIMSYRGHDNNFYRVHTDIDALVDQTLRILEDKKLHERYSKLGRAFAMANSWDMIAEEWDRAISSMVVPNLEKPIDAESI